MEKKTIAPRAAAQAPTRRAFFGSAVGAGYAATLPPIFTIGSASALAALCDQTLALMSSLDGRDAAPGWDEDRYLEALDEIDAGYERAITEPSQGLSDIVAKARLALDDMHHCKMGPDNLDPGEKLAMTVLREIVALGSA